WQITGKSMAQSSFYGRGPIRKKIGSYRGCRFEVQVRVAGRDIHNLAGCGYRIAASANKGRHQQVLARAPVIADVVPSENVGDSVAKSAPDRGWVAKIKVPVAV